MPYRTPTPKTKLKLKFKLPWYKIKPTKINLQHVEDLRKEMRELKAEAKRWAELNKKR